MPSSRRDYQKSGSFHRFRDSHIGPSSINVSLPKLKNFCCQDQEAALALSTRKKYMCAWKSFFFIFCQLFDFPFRPTAENLCLYISVSCQSISPQSVEVYLSGISYMFRSKCPDIICETNHHSVRRTLRGCKKQFSKPISRKEPLSLKLLDTAVSSLGRSFDECLFLAILSVGFAGLHRLGELVVPDDKSLLDVQKIIHRGSLSFSSCNQFAKYILPYHKGNPNYLGSPCVVQYFENSPSCPIFCLKSYLRMRDLLHVSETALFVRENGLLPSRSWFLRNFHQIFPKQCSGHSLRSGGANNLAQKGASTDFIQSAGRWSSDAFRWRSRACCFTSPGEIESPYWCRLSFRCSGLFYL